eukprot:gb/GEZN01000331.1/.p1 GENE.gb/GEZN01000331.1/~~gb/GEZN01000331.1/.p1  ORF type:complete len:1384 (-),score=143.38 gb/GEZN01000331.1/:745-4896(-)
MEEKSLCSPQRRGKRSPDSSNAGGARTQEQWRAPLDVRVTKANVRSQRLGVMALVVATMVVAACFILGVNDTGRKNTTTTALDGSDQDCVYTTSTSNCSRLCGSVPGVRKKTIHVLTQATGNGKACPLETLESCTPPGDSSCFCSGDENCRLSAAGAVCKFTCSGEYLSASCGSKGNWLSSTTCPFTAAHSASLNSATLNTARRTIAQAVPPPPINAGAFEGGPTGTAADTTISNILQQADLVKQGKFEVPTGGPPSPLFAAEPFTFKMLRFQEMTPTPFNPSGLQTGPTLPVPAVDGVFNGADGPALDAFLTGRVHPDPVETVVYNAATPQNPWKAKIEAYLGRPVPFSPMEGRPPGPFFARQRWADFPITESIQTAQAGARTNSGFRDPTQRHNFASPEFGPGGLYNLRSAGIDVRFHPAMPVQRPDVLWTFDGTFPPKLIQQRYGVPLLMRHHNTLPIDVTKNAGFGVHTLTTHNHNGHNPAESDGFTQAFYFPGQFYDYVYPMALAGHDSINVNALDPRAASPNGRGGTFKIPGDFRETMSTHWYHDHMFDYTAQNVYKGNAGMYNLYSALDRGNEAIDDGVNLRFPSGEFLDWGNRDYDVNLDLADKAFDQNGQLWMNPFEKVTGFIGDVMTVNFCYKPWFPVRARRYRFRMLAGSVSRLFKVALAQEDGTPVPLYIIANDGNIMEHSVLMEDGILPTFGISERYDIIVDFSSFTPGTKLYFVNMLEHRTGQVVNDIIPLADLFPDARGNPPKYDNSLVDGEYQGDPVVGKFMELRVRSYNGVDKSMDPARYTEGNLVMIPVRRPTADELATAIHRTFDFEKKGGEKDQPWQIGVNGDKPLPMDPTRIEAITGPRLEIWRLIGANSWTHPVHIHFEEGVILTKDGNPPPNYEFYTRKDVYRLGPLADSARVIELAMRFRDFSGTFMAHCHNTLHEDNAMMIRWDAARPGLMNFISSPRPTWDGVKYVAASARPDAIGGEIADGTGAFASMNPVKNNIQLMEVGGFDMATEPVGGCANPTQDERAWVKLPLQKGTNIDSTGRTTDVFFVLHDMSDEVLAKQFGVSYAGGLAQTPTKATCRAEYDAKKKAWTFLGDLPNPINRNLPNIFKQNLPEYNNYSPLRRVVIDSKQIVVNAFFVRWGSTPDKQLRIDVNCNFPDFPPNTACMHIGKEFGANTGQLLSINVDKEPFSATFKLHKSWGGYSHVPYYMVVDAFPASVAMGMGVIYAPKHAQIGAGAVPMVQFLPPEALNPSFPKIPFNKINMRGGGLFGGQDGVPSFYEPNGLNSPIATVDFVNWVKDSGPAEEVKSLEDARALQKEGKLEVIPELALVLNCPYPLTLDVTLKDAALLLNKGTRQMPMRPSRTLPRPASSFPPPTNIR